MNPDGGPDHVYTYFLYNPTVMHTITVWMMASYSSNIYLSQSPLTPRKLLKIKEIEIESVRERERSSQEPKAKYYFSTKRKKKKRE